MPSVVGLLEQHELAAGFRADGLREEADCIQAEPAVAELEWQEWLIARRRVDAVLAPDRGGTADTEDVTDRGLRADRRWVQWSGVRDALVRPVGVVEPLELPQGVAQVALVPDQRAVQQLTPTGLHLPRHDRVHSRHLDSAERNVDPRVFEDGIEQLE